MASKTISAPADWQVESDLRTLAEAEAIKKDAKRYKAALALASKKVAELKDVQLEGIEEASETK